jgi:SAM-dependent methyltransferase
MNHSLEHSIEGALRATQHHPDYAAQAEADLAALIEEFRSSGSPPARMNELRARANDVVLMQEKYFRGRVAFLMRLVAYLGERPEQQLDVAEDGCGSGIDLHVIHTLLGQKLNLTGIDINDAALAIAKQRVPAVRYLTDFDDQQYHVIYSDYVSIGDNAPWTIAARGEKCFAALRSPGVVLQQADMEHVQMYRQSFGRKFLHVAQPEFLADIPGRYSCRLYRFEKP